MTKSITAKATRSPEKTGIAKALEAAHAKSTVNAAFVTEKLQSAHKALQTSEAACKEAAEHVLRHLDMPEELPFKARYKLACEVTRDAYNKKLAAMRKKENIPSQKQKENLLAACYRYICIGLAPDVPVQVAAGSGDNGPVVKPASMCQTAQEVREAAKAIREASGTTDGRANNAPKAKPLHESDRAKETVKALGKTQAGRDAIAVWLADLGYIVTYRKAGAKSDAVQASASITRGARKRAAGKVTARAKAK